jgi:hypothetical protein
VVEKKREWIVWFRRAERIRKKEGSERKTKLITEEQQYECEKRKRRNWIVKTINWKAKRRS